MKKIRINELARECEQPNGVIIAILPQFGVTEKKTHSSSIDEDAADAIRRYYGVFVEPRAPETAEEASESAAVPGAGAGAVEAEPAVRPAASTQPFPAGEEEVPEEAPAGPAFPPGLTTEEMMIARPAAHPLRPPLATRRGWQPEPAAPAPPPAVVLPALPAARVAPPPPRPDYLGSPAAVSRGACGSPAESGAAASDQPSIGVRASVPDGGPPGSACRHGDDPAEPGGAAGSPARGSTATRSGGPAGADQGDSRPAAAPSRSPVAAGDDPDPRPADLQRTVAPWPELPA